MAISILKAILAIIGIALAIASAYMSTVAFAAMWGWPMFFIMIGGGIVIGGTVGYLEEIS